MRLASIDLVIFIAYLLVVLALGIYAAGRGTGTKRDYFLAGDKLPWWMIGGSIMAANLSSHHFVGVMGTAYKRGFVAMTIEWGAILIGFNALLWIFLPFYLRNGFYTVPEFLHRRFGWAARGAFAALTLLIYVFIEIAAVMYLGAIAVNALVGVSVVWSILLLGVATALYTIIGGLRSVVWTELVQLVVLFGGGIALSVATYNAAGGWDAVVESSRGWDILLPHDDADFPWTMYLGGTLSISIFYCAANQFIVQRALAAKDEWHARMGVVFTQYLKFLTPLIIIIPGLLAPRLFPGLESPDKVFPTLVQNLLPAGLVGLVMAGLVAAVMGTISGALNSFTTIATIDFFLPAMRWWRGSPTMNRWGPGRSAGVDVAGGGAAGSGAAEDAQRQRIADADGASDAAAVRFGRVSGIVAIVFGMYWATRLWEQSDRPIFLYLLSGYGYFTPGITTMFLLGILWKRTTHAGALTVSLLTIPFSLLLERWYPGIPFQNRTGIAFWTCMAVCIVVSLLTTPKRPEELKGLIWTRESLRLPPGERPRAVWRRPVTWWALVTAATLYFYIRYA